MSQYQSGVCNIGPDEIAARLRAGHISAGAAGVLGTVLIATNAPRWSRLLLALPAAGAASGYLQAHAHFCAGFGSRGVHNFGPLGSTQPVTDPQDRARDARTSRRIGLQSGAIGLAVAAAAMAVPRR